MRRRLRLLLPLLVLAFFAAAGCGTGARPVPAAGGGEAGVTAEDAAPGSEAGQDENPEIPLTLTYSHPDTGLTLTAPEGWTVYPLEEAVVALISPQRGEEDFFRENILVTADDQFPDPTLDRYVAALEAEVRNRYPDTETLESGDLTIAGVPGRWLVDRFTGEKGEARVYRVVLIRDGTAYVLHGTAPVWTFDSYRPIFEAVARSITWVEPPVEDEAAPETVGN
ncbi:MAG: hypothetical protein DIU55_000750 [Bacillota bacterium]